MQMNAADRVEGLSRIRDKHSLRAWAVVLSCTALFGLILAIDILSSEEMAIEVLYVLPVALTVFSRSERLTYSVSIFSSVLTVLGIFLFRTGNIDLGLVNRFTTLIAVWAVTGAVIWKLRTEYGIEKSNEALKESKESLERLMEERTEELRESEARYRSLFVQNKAVMLLIDPSTGCIVDANLAATDYYGYDHGLITAMRISDINTLGPDEVRKEMEHSVLGRKRTFDFRHRLSNGEVRDVEVISGPIEIGGRPLLYSIVHDTTERKRAEMELERSKGRLEAVITAIPAAITIIEPPDGRVTYCNEEAKRMLRFPDVCLVNLDDYLMVPSFHLDGRRYEPDEYPIAKALRSGEAVLNDVLEFERADGSRGFANANAVPVMDSRGAVTAVVGVRFEITELIEVQRELARSNAELRQYAHVASHDLREPLRMITAYLGIIDKKYGGALPEDAKRYMALVTDGAERMKGLIDDLLAFSKVESAGREFAPVDMNVVLSKAVSNLALLISTNRASVVSDPMPVIRADETQMVQLLQNLVGNAVKYHGQRAPEVRISSAERGNSWVFSVQDNGIGIAPEHQDRVFDMFQRLHTREEYEGTGIGLAISKKIVERHGGQIWVESEPGKGSTFCFTVPATGIRGTGGQGSRT